MTVQASTQDVYNCTENSYLNDNITQVDGNVTLAQIDIGVSAHILLYKSEISDQIDQETIIVQLDGNNTGISSNVDSDDAISHVSADDTNYETDDEIDPCPSQAILFPIPGQNPFPGVPLKLMLI